MTLWWNLASWFCFMLSLWWSCPCCSSSQSSVHYSASRLPPSWLQSQFGRTKNGMAQRGFQSTRLPAMRLGHGGTDLGSWGHTFYIVLLNGKPHAKWSWHEMTWECKLVPIYLSSRQTVRSPGTKEAANVCACIVSSICSSSNKLPKSPHKATKASSRPTWPHARHAAATVLAALDEPRKNMMKQGKWVLIQHCPTSFAGKLGYS